MRRPDYPAFFHAVLVFNGINIYINIYYLYANDSLLRLAVSREQRVICDAYDFIGLKNDKSD